MWFRNAILLLYCLGKWWLYPIQRRSVPGLSSDEDESSISPFRVHPERIFSWRFIVGGIGSLYKDYVRDWWVFHDCKHETSELLCNSIVVAVTSFHPLRGNHLNSRGFYKELQPTNIVFKREKSQVVFPKFLQWDPVSFVGTFRYQIQ